MKKVKKEKLNKIFEENDVVLAYLFGSAAKGQTGPLSDIDIAVLFSEKVKEEDYFDKKLHLAGEIGSLFKTNRVDVINLKTVRSPLLKHNAVFEGQAIFVKDKELQFEIETKIMKEYEDTKHLRKVAYEILERHVREGTFGKAPFSPKQERYFAKHGRR